MHWQQWVTLATFFIGTGSAVIGLVLSNTLAKRIEQVIAIALATFIQYALWSGGWYGGF